MVIKKYEAVGLVQYTTFVMVDGKRVDIKFTPGISYYNKSASYTCSDRAIQDALESTNAFKSGLLSIISVTEKIEPPKEVVIIKEDDKDNEEQDANNELVFDNLKALQMHLMKAHKISFAEIRSKDAAIARAEELGLNIQFK